jgi:hypothetical protein
MGPEKIVGHVVPDQAALYVLYPNSTAAKTEVKPISISNGLVWNKGNTLFYYIDTATNQVDVFDFDLERGEICEFLCIYKLLYISEEIWHGLRRGKR